MRGRRLSAIITVGLSIALVGCGGGDEIAPEVPGPPADVVLPDGTLEPTAPEDEGASSGDATQEDDATSGEDGAATDEGTATPEATAPSGDTGATTPDSSGGGATAPEETADSPTNDTAPPAGSEAEQFEDFCTQNPGAC
jgi:hypothetical protein